MNNYKNMFLVRRLDFVKNFKPKKTHIVYKLVFPCGEFYFGCTKNLKQRVRYHNYYKGRTGVSKAIHDYGIENVSVHVVTNVLTKRTAKSIEADLIKEHYYQPGCLNEMNPKGMSCKVGDKISATIRKKHKNGHYDHRFKQKVESATA